LGELVRARLGRIAPRDYWPFVVMAASEMGATPDKSIKIIAGVDG
jgi:hypothetical protein